MLAAVQANAFSNQGNPSVSGKVVETMDSGGYTYLYIDNGSDMKSWVAIPQTQVKVGEQVTADGGMVMQNFTSQTLGRTFSEIIFASGITR
jgi:hypothetical protein